MADPVTPASDEDNWVQMVREDLARLRDLHAPSVEHALAGHLATALDRLDAEKARADRAEAERDAKADLLNRALRTGGSIIIDRDRYRAERDALRAAVDAALEALAWADKDDEAAEAAVKALRPGRPPMADPVTCDGSGECAATLHIHGCYADRLPARCDKPQEHELLRRPAPMADPVSLASGPCTVQLVLPVNWESRWWRWW